jgi:hypothetical protein
MDFQYPYQHSIFVLICYRSAISRITQILRLVLCHLSEYVGNYWDLEWTCTRLGERIFNVFPMVIRVLLVIAVLTNKNLDSTALKFNNVLENTNSNKP